MTTVQSGLVTFDVTLHVGDACPLDYCVDQTGTTLYVGEIGTSATIMLADPALLTLARVTRDAVHAALSALDVVDRPDATPTEYPPDLVSGHPDLWTDTIVTVAESCPISFILDGEIASILLPDDTTLRLTFHRRGLLEFAQLANDAAAAMLHRRQSCTVGDKNEHASPG
jgi:hypothetical protein